MGVPLNNVKTADGYTPKNTLDSMAACIRLNIDVFNQSIFWQVRISNQPIERSGTWHDEVFMGPGSRTIGRRFITGARVRSAVPGKPAQVTLEAVTPGEVGGSDAPH